MEKKTARLEVLKIFLITFVLSVGVSVIAELFLSDMGLIPAVIVVLILICLGVFFDIVGVAFTSCDQMPFVSMSAKKIKSAKHALKLLKKADVVANICNDVIGDICGIVSGAAGAAIVVKIAMSTDSPLEFWLSIGISGMIAALTVTGKKLGKSYAIKNSVSIVNAAGGIAAFFSGDKEKKKDG